MKAITKLLVAGALAGAIVATVSLTAGAEQSDSAATSGETAGKDYAQLISDNSVRILEKTEAKVFESADGTALNYRAYYSPAYDAEDKANPAMVFVFLHGSGGKGDDNEKQITDQPATVNYLASDAAEEFFAGIPYIVIAPQCPEGAQWVDTPYAAGSYSIDAVAETPYSKAVYELIQSIIANENGDASNVILGGISMGGYGTWDLALRHPETFNAIYPICGGGDPSKASVLKDNGVKVWAFHCDGDRSVPVAGSREMIAALEEIGADAVYTEFEIAGHNAWTPALKQVKDPYLIEWMFDECRKCTVNITVGEGGSVQKTTETVRIGETVRLEISTEEGYLAEGLTVNGEAVEYITDDSGNLSYECVAEGNMEVVASFAPIPVEETPEEPKGLPTAAKVGIIAAAVAAVVGGAAAFLISKKKKK